MNTAKFLANEFYGPKMEGELFTICELLSNLGRCINTTNAWGQRVFKFEDSSYITFGILGPLVN